MVIYWLLWRYARAMKLTRNLNWGILCILIWLAAACSGGGTQTQEQPGLPSQTPASSVQGGYPIPPTGATEIVSPGATPAAPTEAATVTQAPTLAVVDCSPTNSDSLGPFYTPGAPVRDKVGEGYVLHGTVRSSVGCGPIPDAQVEVWMANPQGVYTDDFRATLIASPSGEYRFETTVPVAYGGRPPHIHVKVSAAGFQDLVTQHYPQQGQSEASFDLVLTPE